MEEIKELSGLPAFTEQALVEASPSDTGADAMQSALVTGEKEIFRDRESNNIDEGYGAEVFSWLTKAGEIISPWWSKRRDADLRRFWMGCDHLAGAFYSMQARMTGIPIKVEPRDRDIRKHAEQARIFQTILDNFTESRSDRTSSGWVHGFGMLLLDLLTQDNGAILAVEGPGRPDGPLTGRPTKLIHLDSFRCTRTRNPKFPVVYQDYDGGYYKLHRARVIALSSLASPSVSMHGVGFCAESRCINNAQVLIDMLTYKQEKMGSRPARQMIVGRRGVTAEDIGRAFYSAEQSMDAQSLTRYAKTVVIAPRTRSASSEIDIQLQDLASVPDGFDESSSTMLAMFVVALSLGIPARWLWPATSVGATKADALLQHTVGLTLGPATILRMLKQALETKFLPPYLMIHADYQDDEQDRAMAEIRKTRSEQRKTDLESGVITQRVAREQALIAGDITESQFRHMELIDGRLDNGDDVLSLFYSKDPYMQKLLDVGVNEPLAMGMHDPLDVLLNIEAAALEAERHIAQAPNEPRREDARTASAALAKLKELYEGMAGQQIQSEMGQEIVNQATESMPAQAAPTGEHGQGGGPQSQQQGGIPDSGTKILNGPNSEAAWGGSIGDTSAPFSEIDSQGSGVGVWTVGGRKFFTFSATAGQRIGGELARDWQGRFANAGAVQGAVRSEMANRLAARRMSDEQLAENRATVGQELNILADDLNAMHAVWDTPLTPEIGERMLALGLVRKSEETGEYMINGSGVAFMSAANVGDVEKARAILERAKIQQEKEGTGKGAAAGGAAGKINKEEQEEENRDEVKKGVSGDLSNDEFDALVAFRDGEDIDPGMAKRLAQRGLIEIDMDDSPRLSRDGKSFLKAADGGEVREAKDVMSRARERVQDIQARLGEMQAQAESVTDRMQQVMEQLARRGGSGRIKDRLDVARLRSALIQAMKRLESISKRTDKASVGIGGERGLIALGIQERVDKILAEGQGGEGDERPLREPGQKGGPGSGNWGHFGRIGLRGGSASAEAGAVGGGFGGGLDRSQRDERPDRPATANEKAMRSEIEEAESFMSSATGAERDGIASYAAALRTSFQQEQEMNDALYTYAGKMPDNATGADWEQAAQGLKNESYEQYKKYTREGIELKVSEERGAQDAGYAIVGSEQIMVKRGAFSRREAARMEGELWGRAKSELVGHQGELLKQAGFTTAEIERANFGQRSRLLREIGAKQVGQTARGKPARIDRVPASARARVTQGVGFDLAATALAAANDALALPSLGGYQKMELADIIRATKVNQ